MGRLRGLMWDTAWQGWVQGAANVMCTAYCRWVPLLRYLSRVQQALNWASPPAHPLVSGSLGDGPSLPARVACTHPLRTSTGLQPPPPPPNPQRDYLVMTPQAVESVVRRLTSPVKPWSLKP